MNIIPKENINLPEIKSELMRERLGDEYVVLLRTHYFIADILDITGLEDLPLILVNTMIYQNYI